jgi:hypothetical protein
MMWIIFLSLILNANQDSCNNYSDKCSTKKTDIISFLESKTNKKRNAVSDLKKEKNTKSSLENFAEKETLDFLPPEKFEKENNKKEGFENPLVFLFVVGGLIFLYYYLNTNKRAKKGKKKS